jgi:SpoVK/Ycf46/Vps4 family AAA+-type ATPase
MQLGALNKPLAELNALSPRDPLPFRRRMEKRIIIDLPDLEQRKKLLEINLKVGLRCSDTMTLCGFLACLDPGSIYRGSISIVNTLIIIKYPIVSRGLPAYLLDGTYVCNPVSPFSQNSKICADVELDELARQLAGYSGDDCCNLCRRAAMNVMRRMMVGKSKEEIQAMNKDKTMEPMAMADFLDALATINSSVSKEDVRKHQEWFAEFGSM